MKKQTEAVVEAVLAAVVAAGVAAGANNTWNATFSVWRSNTIAQCTEKEKEEGLYQALARTERKETVESVFDQLVPYNIEGKRAKTRSIPYKIIYVC